MVLLKEMLRPGESGYLFAQHKWETRLADRDNNLLPRFVDYKRRLHFVLYTNSQLVCINPPEHAARTARLRGLVWA
jgi:hypothetical protein